MLKGWIKPPLQQIFIQYYEVQEMPNYEASELITTLFGKAT